jgi:hypothetical protein
MLAKDTILDLNEIGKTMAWSLNHDWHWLEFGGRKEVDYHDCLGDCEMSVWRDIIYDPGTYYRAPYTEVNITVKVNHLTLSICETTDDQKEMEDQLKSTFRYYLD